MTTDTPPITSVWSAFGHKFITDGEYEVCLTCGAMYILRPLAGDPTCGEYLAADGSEPTTCSHDTSAEHGYEVDTNCNCWQCK
jgi:hypothetical protein